MRLTAIDSVRDDAAMRATDDDRLRLETRALALENDRLRREAEQARATVEHLQSEFARQASELASVYESRSWPVAQLLRTLLRRRSLLPARPRPIAAPAGEGERAMPGITPIVPPAGPDSVAACNRAAAACDRFVALWDGVSPPQPGWLTALANALERCEGSGMAGALLLAEDGRIAAAGATLRPDGSLAPLGAGERPDHPAFASVAEVEALPFGAVMLPAKIWRRFGGLDESILAPSLALADLALRLRAAGLSVLCQPFARLTVAAPPPAEAWAEAFGRWRVRRRRATGGLGLGALGLPPRPAPRALLVDTMVPTPDRDSGSADIHGLLRIFVSFGYQVTLLPVGDLARADGYVDELRGRGVRVVANGRYATAVDFLDREPDSYDVIMLFRGSVAGGAMIDRLKAHSPAARLLLYAGDLHFLRLEREALLTRSAEKLNEALRSEQIELAAILRADRTLLLSSVEQRLIADLLPGARTCIVPIARDVQGTRAPFAPRHGVLFVGSFLHRPNVDAMLSFVRDVWPLLRVRLSTTLTIVGGDAPPEVAALAGEADGIVVRGYVADLESLLATCRLTVAPLRFGAGIKGKIASSLAAGVPCVASPVAVEGTDLVDGVHVRVAATPEAFAEAVTDVHEREAIWTALSDCGLEYAHAHFSLAATSDRLAALLRDLGLPAGERDRPGT